MLSDDQKKKIQERLTEKKVIKSCPRCDFNSFAVLDGIFNETLQETLSTIKIGGPSIPTIVVACLRCGYISEHSVGILGLTDLVK